MSKIIPPNKKYNLAILEKCIRSNSVNNGLQPGLLERLKSIVKKINQIQDINTQRNISPFSDNIANALYQLSNIISTPYNSDNEQETKSLLEKHSLNLASLVDQELLDIVIDQLIRTDQGVTEGFSKHLVEMNEKVNRYSDEVISNMQNMLNDAQVKYDTYNKKVAEKSVSECAMEFGKESDSHQTLSSEWRKSTYIWLFILLTLGVIQLFVSLLYTPSTNLQMINLMTAKAVLLFIVSFGLIWSSKNYKSHKHNQIVNSHRYNALLTFQAFVDGTTNIEVRDKILLYVAQTCFSSRKTGFDYAEKSTSTEAGLSLETISGFLSKKS